MELTNKSSLNERFEFYFKNHPEKKALIYRENTYSYGKIGKIVNKVANNLSDKGHIYGDVTVILLPKCPELYIAMMSVLKTRGTFIIVNPFLTPERIFQIIQNTNPKFLISSANHAEIVRELEMENKLDIVYLNAEAEEAAEDELYSFKMQEYDDDENPYYFATSGTSGIPKIVKGRSISINHYVNWQIKYFQYTSDDIISQLTSISSDAILKDVFPALCSGAALCIPSEEDMVFDGDQLVNWVKKNRISCLHIFPSLLKKIVESGRAIDLRYLLVSGEVFQKILLRNWWKINGYSCKVFNLYGPTESTVIRLFHEVSQSDLSRNSIPLGRPIPGTRIFLLNEKESQVPQGTVGEICIQSPFLTAGYLNNPEANTRAFIVNPFTKDARDIVYKTGDLGKLTYDGLIEYVGRKDNQIKILGNRIEIEEIESLLVEIDSVDDAAVVTKKNNDDEIELIGFLKTDLVQTKNVLRQKILAKLPSSIMPKELYICKEFPLNENQKVDKAKLLDSVSEYEEEELIQKTLPITDIEKKIAGLWCEVLNKEELYLEDNFFALGGNSMKIVVLTYKIQQQFQIQIDFSIVFKNSVLKDFIEEIERLLKSADYTPQTEFERVSRESDKTFASYAQKRLWILDKLDNVSSYSMPVALKIRGNLNAGLMENAIKHLVERHEVLRTTFLLEDELKQVIHSSPEWQARHKLVERVEVSDLLQLGIFIEKASNQPMDLENGPLFKAAILTVNPDEHILFLNQHHVISDGFSIQVLLNDLLSLYGNELMGESYGLEDLKIQYRDYAFGQKKAVEENLNNSKEYWNEQLKILPEEVSLPSFYKRPDVFDFNGNTLSRKFDKKKSEKIFNLSKQLEVSTFIMMTALIRLSIHRLTGTKRFALGTPVHGRDFQILENQLGCYINNLILINEIEPRETLLEFIQNEKNIFLNAYKHRDYPFDLLVEDLQLEKDPSRNPLFDILIVKDELSEISKLSEKCYDLGLEVSPYEHQKPQSKYDITFNFFEADDEFILKLEYRTNLFCKKDIERIFETLSTIVDQMDLEQKIFEIETVDPARKFQILTEADNCKNYEHITIHERFINCAAKFPDRLAVIDSEGELTYSELLENAYKIADALLSMGQFEKGDAIVIYTSRNSKTIAAKLGVLIAGGVYVPMAKDISKTKCDKIFYNSGIKIYITDRSSEICPPDNSICLELEEVLASGKETRNYPGCHPENIAYTIYTSGSTGEPKGVQIRHESVVNMADGLNELIGLEMPLKVALTDSMNFDSGVQNIYGALLCGHTLVIISDDNIRDGSMLIKMFKDHNIDFSDCTPGLFSIIVESAIMNSSSIPLKAITIAGEVLPVSILKRFYTEVTHPVLKIFNVYGPTECTVNATAYEIDKNSLDSMSKIPIGKSLLNYKNIVLDEYQKLVHPGVNGELYIGGIGVAKGYVNDRNNTEASFIDLPQYGGRYYKSGDIVRLLEDGNIDFVGRNDTQVKIRGYRVELGEIESVINKLPEVSSAIVLADRHNDENELIAYIVPQEGKSVKDSLYNKLNGLLPDYMIPKFVIELKEFILNSNGKLDKAALPQPDRNKKGAESAVPEELAGMTRIITNVFEDLLNREVSSGDNFFALGGHSIGVIKCQGKLLSIFGKKLNISDFYRNPTPVAIAELLHAAEEIKENSKLLKNNHHQRGPLSHAQKRLWLVSHVGGDENAYVISHNFKFKERIHKDTLEKAVNILLNRHDILRTTFHQEKGEIFQVVNKDLHVKIDEVFSNMEKDTLDRIQNNAKQGINMESGPLIRMEIVHEENNDLLLFAIHHIVCDGWSADILFNELQEIYEKLLQGDIPSEERTFQYLDYVEWHNMLLNSEFGFEAEKFWKQKLSDLNEPVEMPIDYDRPPVKPTEASYVDFTFSYEETAQIQSFNEKNGFTMFQFCLASIKLALALKTNATDIIIGCPTSGRSEPGQENMIGFFINDLIIRTKIQPNKTILSQYEYIKEECINAFQYREYPFDKIIENTKMKRTRDRFPLYDISFNMDTTRVDENGEKYESKGIWEECFETEGIIQPDWIIYGFLLNKQLNFKFAYTQKLYKQSTILDFFNLVKKVMHDVLNSPDKIMKSEIMKAEEISNGEGNFFDFNF